LAFRYSQSDTNNTDILFSEHIKVFAYSQFKVQPILTDKQLLITISVESYQNDAFIRSDLNDLMLLKVDGIAYDDSEWVLVSKSDTQIQAEMSVPRQDTIQKESNIELFIFLDETLHFTWH